MRALAWLLFCVGTGLAAAFGAKLRPDEVFSMSSFFGASWWPFWGGVLLSVTGGLMLRGQLKAAEAGGEGADAVGLPELRARLAAMAEATARIASPIEEGRLDAAAMKAGLDALLGDPLLAFTESRGVLAGQAGVAVYAEVMTRFASAERKLNRAWSALVDENPGEAGPQIVSARDLLREALAVFPS